MPSAQALPAPVAVTPARVLPTPAGSGLGTVVQRAPFQCSIRVSWPFPSLVAPVWPTAQTLLAEVAVTALNWPPVAGSGNFTVVHLVPFQCSISGLVAEGTPGPGPIRPTAQALSAEIAATALK